VEHKNARMARSQLCNGHGEIVGNIKSFDGRVIYVFFRIVCDQANQFFLIMPSFTPDIKFKNSIVRLNTDIIPFQNSGS
jgi:hypothetical protein